MKEKSYHLEDMQDEPDLDRIGSGSATFSANVREAS